MPKFAIDYVVEEQWYVEIEADSKEEAEYLFWNADHDSDREFVQSDVRSDIITTEIPS